MEDLKKKILYFLHVWCDLTPDERINLHKNVRYAVSIINQARESKKAKIAGTLPFMQFQGASNYCGAGSVH